MTLKDCRLGISNLEHYVQTFFPNFLYLLYSDYVYWFIDLVSGNPMLLLYCMKFSVLYFITIRDQ